MTSYTQTLAGRLAGRTAIVTGSTSGIGAAIAEALAAEGATVVVGGRDSARGRLVVKEIEAAGGRASFVAADLGASSGRIMLGGWDGRAFSVHELHRFANGAVHADDGIYWDFEDIWSQIRLGLKKYRSSYQQPGCGGWPTVAGHRPAPRWE